MKQEGWLSYISYVSRGQLVYDEPDHTYSCRGGNRMTEDGRSEVEVLEVTHIQLSVHSLKGRFDIRSGGVQIDSQTYLPRDRWTSAGTVSALGTVYLRGPAETSTSNFKLICRPLVFLILAPLHEDEEFVSLVNVLSRIMLSNKKTA